MEQDPHAPEPVAQPPGTAPPVQPPIAGPGAPPPGAPPAQAPKSNKALIIVLIVVLLLLCSCCAIAGGGYLIYDDILDEMVLAPAEPVEEPTEFTLEEEALEEWLAWEPSIDDDVSVSPTDRQQDIAQEAMAQLHPLFTVDEVVAVPGGYDETDDVHYADEYLVAAHMTEYPEIEIYEQVYAPSAEGVADGDPTLDYEAFGEGYLLGTLSDGSEFVYPDDYNALLDGPPEDIQQLLLLAAERWPGGTVGHVYIDPDEEGAVWLAISTWEHVSGSWEFEGVQAKYVLQDGEWVLDEYDWTLLE